MEEQRMAKKKKRSFTPEQKLAAVKIVQDSGKSVATVAQELGLSVSSLRIWVKRAEIDAGNGPAGALTTDERAEVTRLRRENRRLEQENAFLKKASAFFAKESL